MTTQRKTEAGSLNSCSGSPSKWSLIRVHTYNVRTSRRKVTSLAATGTTPTHPEHPLAFGTFAEIGLARTDADGRHTERRDREPMRCVTRASVRGKWETESHSEAIWETTVVVERVGWTCVAWRHVFGRASAANDHLVQHELDRRVELQSARDEPMERQRSEDEP